MSAQHFITWECWNLNVAHFACCVWSFLFKTISNSCPCAHPHLDTLSKPNSVFSFKLLFSTKKKYFVSNDVLVDRLDSAYKKLRSYHKLNRNNIVNVQFLMDGKTPFYLVLIFMWSSWWSKLWNTANLVVCHNCRFHFRGEILC